MPDAQDNDPLGLDPIPQQIGLDYCHLARVARRPATNKGIPPDYPPLRSSDGPADRQLTD